MDRYVLGISAFYHDAAAALLGNGEIVAAAQEERFTRRKHDPEFPSRAVGYCLHEAGIESGDLEAAIFYERPLIKFERLLETHLTFAPQSFQTFRSGLPGWLADKLDVHDRLGQELGPSFQGEMYTMDHHASHAASAFYPSPFQEAAILTLDAVGEWATSSMGVGHDNRVELLREMRFPHSVGMLYSAFTFYTGFRVNSGEYKLMGLAPYGTPRFRDAILEHLVRILDDGSIWLDMSYFDYGRGTSMTSDKFHELFGGPPRKPEGLITQKEMDLAASIQSVCEDVVLTAADYLHADTGLDNLVLAGGVALNCVANGRLRREGPFDRIWVQPAAGDAGGALGAALHYWHQVRAEPRTPAPHDAQKGSFLGPSFNAQEIAFSLDSVEATYVQISDEDELLDRVVTSLEAGEVVGWFQGRMEYGPRALGHRSIIGDARSTEMQRQMNQKIKFRESFRPFAPCVLREHAHEIFEMEADEDSPYMLFVAPVREEWLLDLNEEEVQRLEDPDLRIRVSVPKSHFPAITHVDNSARIQTVDEGRHGRFYRMMKRFRDRSGSPVIVNTSFNIRGEPIVCTPEDAYRCFMATDMDLLVIEDFVLRKQDQPVGLIPGLDRYRDQHPLD